LDQSAQRKNNTKVILIAFYFNLTINQIFVIDFFASSAKKIMQARPAIATFASSVPNQPLT